jgi:hypothetical protein
MVDSEGSKTVTYISDEITGLLTMKQRKERNVVSNTHPLLGNGKERSSYTTYVSRKRCVKQQAVPTLQKPTGLHRLLQQAELCL